MKRGVIFAIVFLVSFISAVSAAGTCDSSQVIMYLSDNQNAHGADYNNIGSYNVPVCYDSLFGVQFTGANPHSCTGTNAVLSLSGQTNAHAEQIGLGNYPVTVCYGDLQCTPRSGACAADETFVVGMTSISNAHLTDTLTSNYAVSICCKVSGSGGGQDFTLAEWRDSVGSSQVTESFVGRVVGLYADTTFEQGTQVTFEIYEKDLISDDSIRTVAQGNALTGIVDSNGRVLTGWMITQNDFDKSSDHEDYVFVASVGAKNIESGNLKINEGTDTNSYPEAEITDPKHRQIYFVNVPILFNHSSTDADGPIASVKWEILEDSFSSNEDTFMHSFTTTGQKTIRLTVKDEQGLEDAEEIAILVIGDNGLLAYVNEPYHQEIVPQNKFTQPLVIHYNGSDSYVISSSLDSSCNGAITCLAGSCPAQTENYPATCTNKVDITGEPEPFTDLDYSWKFSDGEAFQGPGKNSGYKVFGKRSTQTNDKNIELLLNYNKNGLSLQKKFTREFTLGQCVNNGATFLEIDSSGEIIAERDTLASSACVGADLLKGTADDCCPIGQVCNGQACELSEEEVCADFTDKNECNNAPASIYENDPLWDNECENGVDGNGRPISCSCGWNATLTECEFRKTRHGGGGGSDQDTICRDYTCGYSYQQGECHNGYMEVNISISFDKGTCPGSDLIDSSICGEQGTKIVPCGRPKVELGFFDWSQFVFALFVILAVYLVLHHKQRRS